MTQARFKKYYSPMVMPQPFAHYEDVATIGMTTDSDSINFIDGFPDVYSAPKSNGGKFVTREDMNAIGNLASRNNFYHRCGGINTFDPALAEAIGGYPNGAVLDYFDGVNLLKVLSLTDHNRQDFREGVFADKWMLLNQPEPNLGALKIGKWNIGGVFGFSGTIPVITFKAPKSGLLICNVTNIVPGEYSGTPTGINKYFVGSAVLALATSSSTFPLPTPVTGYADWKNVYAMGGSAYVWNTATSAKLYEPDTGAVTCNAGDFVSVCFQNGVGLMYTFDIEISII